MKASLFSFVAAAALFVATAASAAPAGDHDRDLRRMSPRERARYEQAQRERARFEQAQRERERQQAIERARWEAQHRYDRGPARPYGR
jgi:Ni/Co efflux regulator RcnB